VKEEEEQMFPKARQVFDDKQLRELGDLVTARKETIEAMWGNPLTRPIHERMPVILPKAAWPLWLGETEASPDELLALLSPYPAELMRAYPIGPAVGNVKNDEPGLLDPLAGDSLAPA